MGTAVRTPLSQSKTLLHQRTATEDTAQRGGGDSASNPTDLTPTGNWPYSPDSASWLAIEYDARHLQPDSPTWLYGGSTARPAFVVVKMYKYDLQRCPLMASESPTHHQLSSSPDFQQNHHRHNSNNAFHHLRHRRPLRPRCRRPGHLRRGSLVLCPFRPRCKPPKPLRPPVSNPLTTPPSRLRPPNPTANAPASSPAPREPLPASSASASAARPWAKPRLLRLLRVV